MSYVTGAVRSCLRNWFLFIPILAIGIVTSVHNANATKPTYEAVGRFVILGAPVRAINVKDTKTPPPTITVTRGGGKATTSATPTPTPTRTPVPAPTTTVVNPYLNTGQLLQAVTLIQLNSVAFRTQIANAGQTGTFVVSQEKGAQIYDVTATARRRPVALSLAKTVLAQVDTQIVNVQKQAGAPAGNLYGAEILNVPLTTTDKSSSKTRPLVAGLAVTGVAAIALSIGLDNMLLALRRRREARSAGTDVAPTPGHAG